MKHLLYIFLLLPFFIFSQTPQFINYEAAVYDSNGVLLSSHVIDVKLSIIKRGEPDVSEWIEVHRIETSDEGLFSLQIGNGEKIRGKVIEFIDIDFFKYTYFLKIEIDVDKNGTYIDFGTQQFMMLPYAVYVDKKSDLQSIGIQGIQGEQGVKGPQGEQGIQGFQGEQGIQGPQGEQGIQGSQGEQGIRGEKGERGARGEQGVQGMQGEQGIQGKPGESGPQGERGLQGEQGVRGKQGIKGEPGVLGPQGERGLQGEQGVRGKQGIQGEPGVLGPQGERGLEGEQGVRGKQGIQGESGVPGPQGERGLQGDQGIQGNQGIQGKQGEIGPQGERGFQGDQGVKGEQGIQGEQGELGPQGEPGLKGEVGPRGNQGIQGIQGERGLTGPQGPKGDKGSKGEPGTIPTYMDSLLKDLEAKMASIDDMFKSFESKFGCIDAKACTYNPDASVADNSCEYPDRGYDCEGNISEPYVGMQVFGGIVFKLNETGTGGLVTTLKDVNYIDWESAQDVCEAYNGAGFDDWKLPTLIDLKAMYNSIGHGSNLGNVGAFSNTNYWSSETSKTGNCNQSFGFSKDTGYINCETDNPNLFVRPIRSFSIN